MLRENYTKYFKRYNILNKKQAKQESFFFWYQLQKPKKQLYVEDILLIESFQMIELITQLFLNTKIS